MAGDLHTHSTCSDGSVPIHRLPLMAARLGLSALALSIPFSGFANVIRMQYLIPNGMDGAYILSVILGAVSNLTANSLLIPRCGALGAAVGTVIAEGVVCAAQCLAVKKRIDILAYLKSTAFFGMAGLLMYGAVRVLDQRAEITVSWLLLEIVVGGSVYCILSVLYLYHTKNELLMTALQKLGGAHPVSYTHMTLPTT